jgi:uncharacterized membrane protein
MEDLMSDALSSTPTVPPKVATSEDRIVPAIVYGLDLIGAGHLTVLIGLVIAYVARGSAGPMTSSHYTFQIRTFWLSIWWFVVGVILCIVGALLSVILIGLPILGLGILVCSCVWLYTIIRAVIGLIYLIQGLPHPHPDSWWL